MLEDSGLQKRYGTLYEKLVPIEGKCDTVEGETLRAFSRIGYRYFNDGDKFFEGYGCETAGPAHAYLVDVSPVSTKVRGMLSASVECGGSEYEKLINSLAEVVVEYIESRDSYQANDLDMFECAAHFEEGQETCLYCGEEDCPGASGYDCELEREDEEDEYI
jgi:hypothetical protein